MNFNPTSNITRKVSIFATHYPPPEVGGAESTVKDLAELLSKNDFYVNVHVLRINSEKFSFGDAHLKVTFHRVLNFYHPLTSARQSGIVKFIWHCIESFNLIAIFRAIRILQVDKPDGVLFHNLDGWSFSPWIATKIMRIPSVHYVHDFGLLCIRKTAWSPKSGLCGEVCLRCRFRLKNSEFWSPNRIIFNSHFMQSAFYNLAPRFQKRRHSSVIHPPVKVGKPVFKPSEAPQKPQFTIGYIGRIAPEKGIETVLESCKELNLKLLIAGDGRPEYVLKLKELNSEADFMGRMPSDVFYDLVDIVVIPSIWSEPFGIVVIESLAANKIVIISDSGSLAETASLVTSRFWVFKAGSVTSLNVTLSGVYQSLNGIRSVHNPEVLENLNSLYIESTEKFLNVMREICS